MASIETNGPPIPDHGGRRFYRVIYPRGQQPCPVVFLASELTSVWSHWAGQTLLCTRRPDCPNCRAGYGHRWTGYTPVWSALLNGEAVLAMTEGCVRYLNAIVDEFGPLRGMYCVLQRKVNRPNGPVQAKFLERKKEELLPPAFDVRDSLCRILSVRPEVLMRAQDGLAGTHEFESSKEGITRVPDEDEWSRGI